MFQFALAAMKFLGGSQAIIKEGFGIWAQKNNIDLQKFQAQTDAKQAVIIKSVESDNVRMELHGKVMLQAMNNPIWWIAWALFVIPVGVHHAAVFFVSTVGIDPETFAVLKVPADQRESAKMIVQWIFGLQAGSGVAAGVLQTLSDIFGKQRG